MSMRNGVKLFTTVCLLFLCSLTALAQSQTTGRIAGSVSDSNGSALPGAEITVTNKATGEVRTIVADDSGHFIVPLLPSGEYSVLVTANGFKKFIQDDVKVTITETTSLDAAMVVGSVSETVTVDAVPQLVQTDGSQLGRVVDSRTLSELPLATRNFTQILGLSPGAATYLPDNTSVGRNSQNISVNGARVTNNNFQINGIDANSMGTNSAPSLAVPAPETIQEFKVQTSLYDATFGRSGGGNIQAVTKSGGNDFHGGAYGFLRNARFNANNPFLTAAGVARPVLTRKVLGAYLGGPIKEDKLFFFGSFQATRERNGASIINSLSSSVLIDPRLTNDRSAATLQATYGFAPNPVALALLNAKLANGSFLIPTPTAANGTYTGSTPSVFDENQFNANLDYRYNDRNTFAFKLYFSNAPQTLVLPSFLGGGPNVPGYGNFQQNNNRLATMQFTHIFSPTVFNELRVGYNFIRVDAYPEEPVKDSDVGIARSNASVFPGLGLIQINPAAGGVTIGTSATIDVKAVAPSTTVADTVSITRGSHSLRAGGEFRYNENNYVLNFFTRGQIQFANFTNFLAGVPSFTVFGSGIGNRSLRAHDYNFFVQDDWKVSRKLTLNLGLRYELDLPPYDTRGRIATFDPALYVPRPLSVSGTPIGPPIGGYVQAGNVIPEYDVASIPNVGKRVVNSVDPNNFAPRVGFAYSPLDSGKLVVRGGYGIFYSRTSFQYITLNVIAPPTYVFGVSVVPPITNPFFPAPPTSAFPTLVPGVALSGTLFDRNIRTPFLHQYNVNAQYEVFKNYLLEVGYVGTRGKNLFRQVGINQAKLASTASPITNAVTGAVITTNTPANAALRAPFQGVVINGFFQNQSTAESTYNSLQASLTRRFANGLQFLASYTLAKSEDNASGQGGGPGAGGVLNPGAVGETSAILGNQLDKNANHGLSDFDRKHRFVFSALYDVPMPGIAKGSEAGKLLLGDWQLGTIFTSMSGLPIDVVDTGAGSFYGLSGGSAALARPNLVGDPFANVPAGYFFNPLAFARPVVAAGAAIPSSGGSAVAGAVGTDIGNAGRNIIRGPHQNNVDFSIIKRFRIRETKSIEFRTEFFNLLNTVNYANPISDLNAVPATNFNADGTINTTLGAGRFGRIISTSSNPRLIQFGLKFNF
ncbi:MAG TPA: TonB-dependent receptor [Pyrinomonadaceae bacterium]|nr:TonB-dependent receptor [Pyrinomonadaceae bacterium]